MNKKSKKNRLSSNQAIKRGLGSSISRLLLFSGILLFISNFCWAGAGKTGAEFLLIGAGARPAAMGGTFVAVANDINAISWNPAGLALIKGNEISATYAEWLSDIRYQFIGYGHSAGKFGTFGISGIYLHMGDMEGRSLSGKKTNNFSAYDLSTNLSFGRRISRNISLGASVKFIKQSIEDENATGMAFDLGGLYEIGRTKLILGGALLNLGPGMRFVKEEYSLPLTLNLGIGYKFNNLTVFALDIKHQLNENYTSLSIGTEYWPMDFFALRGGYIIKSFKSGIRNPKFERWDDFAGLGAGLGLKFNRYQFDYAFVPFANLGNTHRISFTGRF